MEEDISLARFAETREKSFSRKKSLKHDEIFLLCAIDGRADCLVSEDKALLVLKPKYSLPIIGSSGELGPILSA